MFLLWFQNSWKNNDNHRILAQWLFFTCWVKFPFVAKVAWQLVHKHFFPACWSWCLARAPDPENDLLQIGHLYSAVWVFLCLRSKVFIETFLWQLSHSHWPQTLWMWSVCFSEDAITAINTAQISIWGVCYISTISWKFIKRASYYFTSRNVIDNEINETVKEKEREVNVHFIVFYLCHCIHARAHALTGALTHGRTHASKMTYPTPILHIFSTYRYKFYFWKCCSFSVDVPKVLSSG